MELNTIPDVGTILKIPHSAFTYLNSVKPVFRLQKESDQWVAMDPALRKGYIVFLDHSVEKDKTITIELVKVTQSCGFAKIIPDSSVG